MCYSKTLLIKDVASYIKKKFDEDLGGTWHCAVGRNFGCSITHTAKYSLFYQLDQTNIVLFQSATWNKFYVKGWMKYCNWN